MSKIVAKEKAVVVPGEVLAEGMDYIPGTHAYREGDKIYAGRLGLFYPEGRAIKLIPLSGRYYPKEGDTIVGPVVDIFSAGWRVDTNSAYPAMLTLRDATSEYIAKGADLRQYYDFGDYVVCKVTKVTSQMLIDLSMKGPGLRKLGPGRVVKVGTHKVPRIIGKKGSMVSLIKEATGTKIVVGQNGVIWLSGEDPAKESVAVKAIEKIAAEAHTLGLTEKIKAFMQKELGA